MSTVRDIVTAAQGLIGEVDGPGVQEYGDDRIMADAVRAFNFVFTKHPWEQFLSWQRLLLGNNTGIVTTDAFENVRSKDLSDFIGVYIDGKTVALPKLARNTNPYTLGSGATPLCWTSLPATSAQFWTRRLQVYPTSAAGYLNVLTRVYPVGHDANFQFDWEDEMALDEDLLAYGTAWMTLATDGVNSAGAQTYKDLYDQRFTDIIGQLARQPIHVRGGGNVPDYWFPAP